MNYPLDISHPNWSNLLAYWKFDEGSGQYVYDSSGNGNTGLLGSIDNNDIEDPGWITSTAPIPPIDPPQNVWISIASDSVYIGWNSVIDAVSYIVYSDTIPDGTFPTYEWTGANTTWTEVLQPDKKFY